MGWTRTGANRVLVKVTLIHDDDGLGGASAVGFFSIDGNTMAELEPGSLTELFL